MDKKTSPEVAEIAGRLLQAQNPFEDVTFRTKVQSVIADRVRCSSPSQVVKLVVPDSVIDGVAELLKPFIDDAISLAGSTVSQSPGDADT